MHNHKNNPHPGNRGKERESSREIERTLALTRAIKRLSKLLPLPMRVTTLQRVRCTIYAVSNNPTNVSNNPTNVSINAVADRFWKFSAE